MRSRVEPSLLPVVSVALSSKDKPLGCEGGVLVSADTNGAVNVYGCVKAGGEWELLTGRNVDARVLAVSATEIVAKDLPAAFFRDEEEETDKATDMVGENDPRYDSDEEEEEEEEEIVQPKNKKGRK